MLGLTASPVSVDVGKQAQWEVRVDRQLRELQILLDAQIATIDRSDDYTVDPHELAAANANADVAAAAAAAVASADSVIRHRFDEEMVTYAPDEPTVARFPENATLFTFLLTGAAAPGDGVAAEPAGLAAAGPAEVSAELRDGQALTYLSRLTMSAVQATQTPGRASFYLYWSDIDPLMPLPARAAVLASHATRLHELLTARYAGARRRALAALAAQYPAAETAFTSKEARRFFSPDPFPHLRDLRWKPRPPVLQPLVHFVHLITPQADRASLALARSPLLVGGASVTLAAAPAAASAAAPAALFPGSGKRAQRAGFRVVRMTRGSSAMAGAVAMAGQRNVQEMAAMQPV